MRWLLVALALLALPAMAAEQRLLVDGDIAGYPAVTEDWTRYWSNAEGLYGVVYSGTISAADTAEIFCDIGVSHSYLRSARIRFLDTDGTAVPVALVIRTDATRDSIGTGLTEFLLDEASDGTITAAWYLSPAGTNGTLIARYLIPHNEWFVLPEWLAFEADYEIGIVLADTAYVNFEGIWTEAE